MLHASSYQKDSCPRSEKRRIAPRPKITRRVILSVRILSREGDWPGPGSRENARVQIPDEMVTLFLHAPRGRSADPRAEDSAPRIDPTRPMARTRPERRPGATSGVKPVGGHRHPSGDRRNTAMTKIAILFRAAAGRALSALAVLVPVATRFCLGFVFVQSGWGKFQALPKVVEYFASLGIPFPHLQAPFVASVELLGGALLLAGLFTRLASLPLAGTMVVALITAKRADIAGLGDLFGTIEFLYLLALGHLAAFGPGPLSIDRFLSRNVKPSPPAGI
jgi:putative oxidoreductase